MDSLGQILIVILLYICAPIIPIILVYKIASWIVKPKQNRKEKLIKDIETAINSTNNYCKKITLYNYWDTINETPKNKIDYDWYYNQLKSFGFNNH